MKLWHREGGHGGERRLVLVHGLGANADVWQRLEKSIDRRWIAPDLRGHGRSPHQPPYGYAMYAADVAELLQQGEEVDIVGHSMGGVVGMALASGWFGMKVRKVVAFGVKIRWAPDEAQKLHALARTPPKLFDTREQAIERYLKVSGLFGLVEASDPAALSGVRPEGEKWRMAADPMINAAAGPEFAPLVRAMQSPLKLGAGSKDPMVNAGDMAPYDPQPRIIEGAGHNAQVEKPAELWEWIRQELR
jgi:pimeloyl-ACP methyl ester carboxylesterase